jgi:aspartyl-tRNA(Asn)/glutamyl-tRNA(Gln) amidotransferase subunit C
LSITVKNLDYLANLAKLKLSVEEKTKFQKELSRIIGYIDQLKELDTESVTLTSHVIAPGRVLREDKVFPSLSQDQSLANAPQKKHGFFRVPKVID